MIYNETKYNSHWDTKKLVELGTFSRGKSKHRPRDDKRLYEGGGYPLIQTGEVKAANLYITKHENEYGEFGLSQSKLWDTGTLCITIAANIAETALLAYPMCFPDSVVGFTAFPEKSSELFMHYVFTYIRNSIKNSVSGSIQDNINIEYLSQLDFKVPDKPSQDKIVNVLVSIDKKIEANNKMCAELETMCQTLYNYWFTQFDFPNADGNPYRTSGGAMVWNAQIKRNIPKDWEAYPLSYIIANINTGLNPRDNFILGNGEIQYITVKNLTCEGTIDFNGCDTIDENARRIIHKRSDIQIGDILFASIAPLGRCYLIQNTPENWDINESVFSIRANTDRITPEYLYMYFMSEGFIKSATSSSTGSIFKGIRISTLSDMIAVVPPKHIAESFSGQIKSILELKEQKNAENQELIKLRDWLLPMLMNGQVTVADPMPNAHILEFNNQKYEQYDVRQAARSFGEDSTDDTADLVKEFIKRRKNDSKS